MTAPANEEDRQETNQIVERAEGIHDRSLQVFIQRRQTVPRRYIKVLSV